jgi:hypothetical protein
MQTLKKFSYKCYFFICEKGVDAKEGQAPQQKTHDTDRQYILISVQFLAVVDPYRFVDFTLWSLNTNITVINIQFKLSDLFLYNRHLYLYDVFCEIVA